MTRVARLPPGVSLLGGSERYARAGSLSRTSASLEWQLDVKNDRFGTATSRCVFARGQ